MGRHVSARELLRRIHRWVALALCAPLVVLGLTGSLLVFEHELAELIDWPPRRIVAGGPEQPVDAILAAARAAAPAGVVPALYIAPGDDELPATVRFAPRRGEPPSGALQVFIDPVSLEPMGARTADSGLVRQVFLLHANLTTRDRSGRTIVGWLGVAMVFFGLSGLVLWWPRAGQWRDAFGVRRGARGFRLFRELHGAAGIWGLAVFLTVSVSGSYLAFPQSLGGALAALLPARDLRASPTVARKAGAQPVAVDAALAAARAALPDGVLRTIGLPARPDQPFRIALARPGDARGRPAVTVFVDPYDARVIERRDPATFSLGETVLAWQHALLPSLFAISGIAMWLIERRARKRGADREFAAASAAE